jgi:hypothetical protein
MASPSEVFTGLRNQLFQGDLAALAAAPEGAGPDGPTEVIGVAMEMGLERGSFLVFGLRDGSARLYLSSGGGSLGGQGRPSVNAAAKKLVQTARGFVERLAPASEHPLPAVGRVRLSIFTPSGVRAAEAAVAELRSGSSELFPLFKGADDIITAFRLAEQQRQVSNEPMYLNCLLTALARGTAASATLVEGQPPPDPAQLTADPVDLEWIAELAFARDRLSSEKIIAMVSKLAGFRWFLVGKKTGRITTRLAAHGGGSFDQARFTVERRRRDGRLEVEIAPIRLTSPPPMA